MYALFNAKNKCVIITSKKNCQLAATLQFVDSQYWTKCIITAGLKSFMWKGPYYNAPMSQEGKEWEKRNTMIVRNKQKVKLNHKCSNSNKLTVIYRYLSL